jgi:hypothetical protein
MRHGAAHSQASWVSSIESKALNLLNLLQGQTIIKEYFRVVLERCSIALPLETAPARQKGVEKFLPKFTLAVQHAEIQQTQFLQEMHFLQKFTQP